MAGKLDYRWHLRQVMAARGMFATTDLAPLLAERGIQAVVEPGLPAGDGAARAAQPEGADGAAGHPGLHDGGPDRTDRGAQPARKTRTGGGQETGVGGLRPKRARISGTGG